ncbi:MAG TPA: hypothetical protein VFU40_08495, partial [Gemmatimonadales bacterium]|nr:hypothetical protein [Gemmatimonadales bacterium]
MPAPPRALYFATALAGVLLPFQATAQASPYISLDDPRLPLLEHLIARGDVADPSPMVRPLRRADAARVLAAADSTRPEGSHIATLIQRLREAFEDSPGNRWSLHGRIGGQAYTHPRREQLHSRGAAG